MKLIAPYPRYHLPLWTINRILIAAVSLAYSASASSAIPKERDFIFDHLEENVIVFQTPNTSAANGETPKVKQLDTDLHDLNYLGVLHPNEGEPYFLFGAKPCQNCVQDKSIFAVRPSNNPKPTSFVYPGKIFEPKSRALVLESRAFFGKCLPNKGDVFIVFQKEKVDRRPHFQPSVLIVEAAKNFLSENLLERHLPKINTTLQLVKRKSCREIEGRNRLMSSRPLDIRTRTSSALDDEEETN